MKKTQKKPKRLNIAMLCINGTIVSVPFTAFLGTRYDKHSGEAFIYLLEENGKRIIHEYHPEIPQIVKISKVTARELKTIKQQINEYAEEIEDDDEQDCICDISSENKQSTKIKDFGIPMFG